MAENFRRHKPFKKPRQEDVLSDVVPVFHPHMLDLDEKNSVVVERPVINIEYMDFTKTAMEEEFVPAKRRPKQVRIPFEMTPTPKTYTEDKADAERPKKIVIPKPVEEEKPVEVISEKPVKKEMKKPKKAAVKKESRDNTEPESLEKKHFKPMRAHKNKKNDRAPKKDNTKNEDVKSLITPYWMSKED